MIVGNHITSELVKYDPRYQGREVTPKILSEYTLESKSDPDRDAVALGKVNAMKEEYGTGVCTLVRIYNATGDSLKYVVDHDWHGNIWKYPYDDIILNGQWSCFLHAHTYMGNYGTCAALILRDAVVAQDVFLGWQSPQYAVNQVYVETQGLNHWPAVGSWSYMQHLLDKASGSTTHTLGKRTVTAHSGAAYSPVVDFVVAHS
jgi:hypothetical protein